MKRIQRKRTKGFRLPPNAVYVGRPSKWGNPYRLDEEHSFTPSTFILSSRSECVRLYRIYLTQRLQKEPNFLDELKGKDLACWCPLDKSCHADVLLEFLEKMEVEK